MSSHFVLDAVLEALAPDESLPVSEWGNRHRRLTAKATNERGDYRWERTPYVREILDALSPSDPTECIWIMKARQLGFTELGNVWLGSVIHQTPGPFLYVMDTIEKSRDESKQRIQPMIEETEVLRKLVKPARERDSGNTLLMKEFPGGVLKMTGANSPSSLRRMPARFVFADEVDAWKGDVGGEGDPVMILRAAQNTYSTTRKFLAVSSPTIRHLSRIERGFLEGDQRYFFVPCPACGHMQRLVWGNLIFDGSSRDGIEATRERPCFRCENHKCAVHIEERHKETILAAGAWRPSAAGRHLTRSYQISALYAPYGWRSWAEMVDSFIVAVAEPFQHKAWWNIDLGEPWEERGESISAEGLGSRLEEYPLDENGARIAGAAVPAGVGYLGLAVDVQKDRLECQVIGFGAQEEAWAIDYIQIFGDTSRDSDLEPEEPGGEPIPSVWRRLTAYRHQLWRHQGGRDLRVDVTTIDARYRAEVVLRYAKTWQHERVFAVMGSPSKMPQLVSPPQDKNIYRAPVFTVCTDTAKEMLYSRLQVEPPVGGVRRKPYYVHLLRWMATEEYLRQLCSQKAIPKRLPSGGWGREWQDVYHRQEVLDTWIYAICGLYIVECLTLRRGESFIRGLGARADWMGSRPEVEPPAEPAASPSRPRRNWATAGLPW